MIKDFTNYQQALKLKSLGFDEQCVAFFQKEYHEITPVMVDDNDQYRLTGLRTCKNSEIPEHYTGAPTFAQAFTFFRTKYPNLDFGVGKIHNGTNNYHYHINLQWEFSEGTYEQAEINCLNKLIDISRPQDRDDKLTAIFL
jgi:hypothetical protein